jgi:hypothetical protein
MLGFQWRPRNALCVIITPLLGLIIMLAIRLGFAMVFPRNDFGDYCRYFLLGLFLGISPLAFVKIRLLKKVDASSPAELREET